MLRYRKALCLFLISLFLMPQAVYARENKQERIKIIEDNAYGLLQALGIMDKNSGVSDTRIVSRSELAGNIYKLLGYDAASYTPVFEDVDEDTQNARYISVLTEMGVISVADKYYPDSPATYEQAVKMIDYILGYEPVLTNAKWPEGFVSRAASAGLTKDIKANIGDELTERMLVSLMYNSLGCKKLIPDMNGNYEYDSSKTLLSENFGVYKKHGVVNANSRTYLSINKNAGIDTVIVGEESYTDHTDDLSSMIGYDVYVYYREDSQSGFNDAIYAQKTDRNNVINIKAKDIDKERMTDFSKIPYSDGSKDKTVKLADNVDVLYNGKAYPSFSVDTLKISTGNLELIDNNADGITDVVMIWEFENYVFDSNDKVNGIIIDKYGRYFNYADIESIDIYSMYGEKQDLNSLVQWNVISVYKSIDGTYAKAVIYDDPVIGQIESMYTQDGKTYIVVDEEHYAIADSYNKAVDENKTNSVAISLNQEGIYYLDADERVAAAVVEQDYSFRYGYLINAAKDNDEECLWIKLYYDAAKGFKNIRAKDSIKIDGRKYDYEQAYRILCSGEESPKQQLVKFMLNGEGDVAYIDTVEQGPGETKDNLTCNAYKEDLYWSVRTGRLGRGEATSFLLDLNNTAVFCVPQEDVYNDARYSMKITAINNNEPLKVSAYDSNSMGIAKVLVIYTDKKQQQGINIGYTGGCIVSSIKQELNNDGEAVYVVEGYKLFGDPVRYVSNGSTDVSYLKTGDFVDFSLDYNNEISYVHMLFDSAGRYFDTAYKIYNDGADGIGEYMANHGHYITGNVIAEKNGKYIKLPLTGTNIKNLDISSIDFNNSQIYSLADAKLYICKKNKLYPITESELESYTYNLNPEARCMFISTYSQLRDVVVYID